MFDWLKGSIIQRGPFLEVIGNDLNFVETVIKLFEEQARDSLKILSKSLEGPDWPSFLRATHDLKNTGRSIASKKLIDHSVELEKLARAGDIAKAQAALKKTDKLLSKARKELNEIAKGGS